MQDKTQKTEKQVSHNDFVGFNAEAARVFEEMERLKSQNTVTRAIKITDKRIQEGQVRKDRKTGAISFDESGEPLYWASKNYVTASSECGVIELLVSSENYNLLTIGKHYMAVGQVVIKMPYEGNKPFEAIEYTRFDDLFQFIGKGA